MNLAKQVTYDNEGYLFNPLDWNESVAIDLATEEGIELNADYWAILHFIQDYWLQNKVAPDVRHVVQFLVKEKGLEKKMSKRYLFSLFPYGYVKQACKIAGMQKPRAWSTG